MSTLTHSQMFKTVSPYRTPTSYIGLLHIKNLILNPSEKVQKFEIISTGFKILSIKYGDQFSRVLRDQCTSSTLN